MFRRVKDGDAVALRFFPGGGSNPAGLSAQPNGANPAQSGTIAILESLLSSSATTVDGRGVPPETT